MHIAATLCLHHHQHLYVAAAAHYLELGSGKQGSEEETRWDFAAAGLHFLAALLGHAAQIHTNAPAESESLASKEVTNGSVTGTT